MHQPVEGQRYGITCTCTEHKEGSCARLMLSIRSEMIVSLRGTEGGINQPEHMFTGGVSHQHQPSLITAASCEAWKRVPSMWPHAPNLLLHNTITTSHADASLFLMQRCSGPGCVQGLSGRGLCAVGFGARRWQHARGKRDLLGLFGSTPPGRALSLVRLQQARYSSTSCTQLFMGPTSHTA